MMELVVPITVNENIAFRKKIRKWALDRVHGSANRKWLMKKCRDDFIFWLKVFCWLEEPRTEVDAPVVRPFIPWIHQIPMMNTINEHLGFRDIGLEKARGEGATWSCLMIFLHRWLFYEEKQVFGIVSRNEKLADNPEDPGSLGAKIDFQLRMLPKWMVGVQGYAHSEHGTYDWKRKISDHTWTRYKDGYLHSSITAYAPTGDLAAGDRKTAFFMDEFGRFQRGQDNDALSASAPATNCRLLVSTYDGADGAYYNCMKGAEDSNIVKIILDWKSNPTRNKGLFTVNEDKMTLHCPKTGEEVHVHDYKSEFFNVHYRKLKRRGYAVSDSKKVWSPWYVNECLRTGMTPRMIAQEYDRDPGGTGSRFFAVGLIEELSNRARPADLIGDLIFDYETLEPLHFSPTGSGSLLLWGRLVGNGKPRPGDYVLGVDVATGQGGDMSSNSVISIVDRTTGQKTGEYANPNISPEQLAKLAVALCRWFKNFDGGPAYMIWEANGPGRAFTLEVLNTTFRNFHYRVALKKQGAPKTKEPGWWSGKDEKRQVLSKYRHALTEGTFENPSRPALRECLQFVNGSMGKVEFQSTAVEDDPANEGENHADRVIADALANYGCEELNGGPSASAIKEDIPLSPPKGTFAYRQRKRQLEDRRARENAW